MRVTGTLFLSLIWMVGSLRGQDRPQGTERVPSQPSPKRPQLVPLHVAAFDSHGLPVSDLSADEFQIQDQGKRQQILSFRSNAAQSSPLRVDESSNRPATGTRAATVILLDLLNADLAARGSGWEGINRALEQLDSGESLYLYLLTADARVFPVRGLPGDEALGEPGDSEWTRQVRSRLESAIRTVNKLKPLDGRDPSTRFHLTFQALELLASRVERMPGRKSVLWISYGVPVYVQLGNTELVDMTGFVRKFAVRLNHAGIAMYCVDQGRGATPGRNTGYHGPDTMEQLANLTGGRIYASNSVEMAVPAVLASAQASYFYCCMTRGPRAGTANFIRCASRAYARACECRRRKAIPQSL